MMMLLSAKTQFQLKFLLLAYFQLQISKITSKIIACGDMKWPTDRLNLASVPKHFMTDKTDFIHGDV